MRHIIHSFLQRRHLTLLIISFATLPCCIEYNPLNGLPCVRVHFILLQGKGVGMAPHRGGGDLNGGQGSNAS